MDFDKLEQRLLEHFNQVRYESPDGTILVGAKSFRLDAELDSLFEKEDRDDISCFGTVEFLEKRYSTKALLSFHWDSFGPCTFSNFLDLLNMDGRSYLLYGSDSCTCLGQSCSWIDNFELHWVAIAALEVRNRRPLLRYLLKDLIHENGEPYRLWLFGGLPSNTENSCEETLSRGDLEEV